ncbi:release factor glutamine methyltransferase [Spirochaetia bacterium]|nr:release factor glutamine methyltransferase [Spirochaetia bacterium]
MTIREALVKGAGLLKSADIDTPVLDAGLLLAEVLHTSRAGLIAAGPDILSEESYRSFQALLKRRLSGECVAYILGRKEFRGLEFTVTPAVLVPRPDTETLVEAVLEKLAAEDSPTKNRVKILDICTGSGAIAISLKHELPELEVWASDISEAALEIARVNAARLLGGRPLGTELAASAKPIHFFRGDLFAPLNNSALLPTHYSLIVSNPPYVCTDEIEALSPEVRREPQLALDGGEDGLNLIRRIIAEAPAYLLPSGWLLLEADPRQMKTIAALLETKGYKKIQTYRDLSGQERVIGASINE